MHMADALISPAIGATMWAATGVTAAYCAKKVREENDPAKIPLMGVTGAFVFAAQMVNFSIPATGSSGHLGGGLILAILLGPEAAFLVIVSVLAVQALFFADGGLLALGCNIFNLGFFPAFVAYPFIFKKIVGDKFTRGRIFRGSLAGALVGLGLGAFGVVLETTMSGISSLPFVTFAGLMMPIHVAIAIVEGLVTAGVVLFVHQMQPDIIARNAGRKPLKGLRLRPLVVTLAVAALISGATLSWFASASPDGLEWSIERVTGSPEIAESVSAKIQGAVAAIQEKTAFLPGYAFKKPTTRPASDEGGASWPAVDAGTSVSGAVGALMVLGVAGALGWVLARRRRDGTSIPTDVRP